MFNSIKQYHQYLQNTPNGCVDAVNHYLQKIEADLIQIWKEKKNGT